MERGDKRLVTDEGQLACFYKNLKAMGQRFEEKPLSGEALYQLLRKVREREKYPEFAKDLGEAYPVLFETLSGNILPSWNTVYKYTVGGEMPTRKFVQDVANFCSKVFSFDTAVLTDDLLDSELDPFPELRRVNERWGRYVGLYRCFYYYPNAVAGETPRLHGGLMHLREEEGALLCRLVTGIRREERFPELWELMAAHPGEEGLERLKAYNDALPEHEGRLVFYDGKADFEFLGYFMMRLHRMKHHNGALVLLRRWDDSAQKRYSGGIAAVTLFRGDDVTSFAMAITRQEMTFSGDGELIGRHLSVASQGEKGMAVSKQMDKYWNHAVMDWSCEREQES